MTPEEARVDITRMARENLRRETSSDRTLGDHWIAVYATRSMCDHMNLELVTNHSGFRYRCPDCGGAT